MTVTSTWIIRADTGEMTPGYYRARLVRNGPQVSVAATVIEDRDPETGDLLSDVVYRLEMDGREITDWRDRFTWGLVGYPITEAEYRHGIADMAWLKANLGMDARKAVDVRAIPPVLPGVQK